MALGAPAAVPAGWADAGAAPGSAAVASITVALKPSDAQKADLASYLKDVVKTGSPSHHLWMTTAQFAARFAPTASSASAVSTWLQTQGLTVDAVSPSGLRVTAHGTVNNVESAFGVTVHTYRQSGAEVQATPAVLTVPSAVSASIDSVRGVAFPAVSSQTESALAAFEQQVDANASAVLTLEGADACTTTDAEQLATEFTPALQQAAAQGITVLVRGACVVQALSPAASELATAVHLSTDDASGAVSIAADATARPDWQVADGLPQSLSRAVPDLALSGDLSTLTAAMNQIVTKAGTRQGAIGSVVYPMAAQPGIFTQPNGVTTTWAASDGLGVTDLQKFVAAFPAGTTATTTSITADNFAPTHGSSVMFTATVTSAGQPVTTGGSVVFATQSATLGQGSLNGNGQATFSTNQLAGTAPGVFYNVTATFQGDGTFAGSASSAAQITVSAEAATIGASAGSGTLGGTVPVTVTLTSTHGVGVPAASITVTAQATGSATPQTQATTQTSSTTSQAVLNMPVTQGSNITFTISCTPSDNNFTCFNAPNVQANIAKGTPTLNLSFAPTSNVVRAHVVAQPAATSNGTLTVTATPPTSTVSGLPAVTGNVQFLDGSTVIGASPLTNGSGTFSTSFAGTTTHSVTAQYLGDANYVIGTSNAVSASGTLSPTTTSVTSTNFTPAYGTQITLTATIASTSPVTGASPGGTVQFFSNGVAIGLPATVTSGSATLQISSLASGPNAISATYSGDTNYAGSSSTTSANVTVAAGTGTLAATISPTTPIGFGTSATVNATVTLTGGGTPSGTVTATVNGVAGAVYLGTLVAGTGSGTASISIPAPPIGHYTVTVSCTASDSFTCSNTVTLNLTVAQGSTTTTVSLNPAQPMAGTPVTITATVAPSTAVTGTAPVITGSVTFSDNGRTLGTAQLANNSASVTVSLPGGSGQSITATYNGDTNWASSVSAPVVVTPTQVAPTVSVNVSNLSPLAGASETITATVQAPSGVTLIPTGVVSFYDTFNGTLRLLGTANLVSNGIDSGVASLTTTNFTGGTHMISVSYAGDSTFLAERSAVLTIATGDFALTMNPSTTSVTSGGSVEPIGLLTMTGGFAGTVTLGCAPPAGTQTTCSFSPAVITGGGITTLTITTVKNTSAVRPVHRTRGGAVAGALLALLVCGLIPRGHRRRLTLLAVLLLSAFAVSTIGCAEGNLVAPGSGSGGGNSGGGSGSGSGTGTPLGAQIFVLTAAATDGVTVARHDYSYQVNVQ